MARSIPVLEGCCCWEMGGGGAGGAGAGAGAAVVDGTSVRVVPVFFC